MMVFERMAGRRLPYLASLPEWGVLVLGALVFQATPVFLDAALPIKDFLAHYRWAVEFSDALAGGDYYPRWMSRAYFGLGEPALLYYSPLFYVCTALLRLLTANTWNAMRLVFLLSTLITGRYAYLILRRDFGRGFALAGAVCLEMMPMVQMLFNYVGEIPWAVSFAGLLALTYYVTRPGAFARVIDLPVAVAVAVLVMTHVLAAFMMLICFSVFLLFPERREGGNWRLGPYSISWTASVTFGLLLSSVYLVPALTSMSYIHSAVWTDKHYTPMSAFSFPTITALVYGVRWFTFQWPLSVSVLLPALAASVFAFRRLSEALQRGARQEPPQMGAQIVPFLLTASWVALFMASELSLPLWLLPTPLRMLQFSHRFLYIASATATLANVIVLGQMLKDRTTTTRQRALAALPLLLAVSFTLVLEVKFMLADAQPLAQTLGRSDDRAPYSGLAEYLPRDAGDGEAAYVAGGYAADCKRQAATCAPPVATGDHVALHLKTSQAGPFRLPVFAFPAWKATVNGAPAALGTDMDTGAVRLFLPKGEAMVSLTWQRLPQERVGAWLSLLSVLTMMALIGYRAIRGAPRARFVADAKNVTR